MVIRLVRIMTLAVVLAGSIASTSSNGAAVPVPQQWRSYWVDAYHEGLATPSQVDKLVVRAQAINANALIVQVGRSADCFCNRSTFPRTNAAIAPLPYDPLDYVIRKAHAAGIQVHAWVNATPVWSGSSPPPQPTHIFNTHGLSATGANRWLNRRVDGAEVGGVTRYLDVANPAAVNYYVAGIASIARGYDIDGIHLDYIRYPDYNSGATHSDWGYSQVSLARFGAATGRTGIPAPDDPAFSQWRRDQVTAYVRKIYLTLYGIDRRLRLSHSAIAYGYGPQQVGGWQNTAPYAQVDQDWKGWLSEGIVDLTIAMNYKSGQSAVQRLMFAQWNEVLADWQGRRQTAVGPGLYLNTVQDSLVQARQALAPSAAGNRVAGWSGFSYGSPSQAGTGNVPVADSDRSRLAAGLTTKDPSGQQPLFATAATVPVMTWKTAPTTGQVAGTVRLAGGPPLDQVPVTLRNVRTGQTLTGRLTDGSGWFGFVDVKPGSWLVTVQPRTGVCGTLDKLIDVRAGQVATPAYELGTTAGGC